MNICVAPLCVALSSSLRIAVGTRFAFHRQVSMECKCLAIEARSHEREQDRGGTGQGNDLDACAMCGSDQPCAGVGNTGTAGIRNDAHVVARESRFEQRRDLTRRGVFGQFGDRNRLQREQTARWTSETGAPTFGVSATKCPQPACDGQRLGRQHRHWRHQAERVGNHVEPTQGQFRHRSRLTGSSHLRRAACRSA